MLLIRTISNGTHARLQLTHLLFRGCALLAVIIQCVLPLLAAGLTITSVAACGSCIWAGIEDGQLLLIHLPT